MMTEALNDSSRQRVYCEIKARVITHELPVGKRILVEPLADQLFISNTPVREALIQLAAERLIKDVPKAGFFTKELSESEIRDLYTLNQLLLDWSLSVTRNDGRVPGMLKPPSFFREMDKSGTNSPREVVRILNKFFIHIAGQSGNADIIHLVQNINDRTYYIRLKEYELFSDSEIDLRRLCYTYHRKEIDRLRNDLQAYIRKTIEWLPDLLRILMSSLPEPEHSTKNIMRSTK